MSQRTATIESLPRAFEMVKAIQADGLDWGEGYRPLGRLALASIIEGRMDEAVDGWLDALGFDDGPDRRNGHYRRHLLTELGDIELRVPRTRRFSPTAVLRAYARRSAEIDRAILAGFVLGLSTRKVGEVLLALLGRPVSAGTVSAVARTLDAAVAAFHARPLRTSYKVLMLDGVVLTLGGSSQCGAMTATPNAPHSALGGNTPTQARRALEQAERSAPGALANPSTTRYAEPGLTL